MQTLVQQEAGVLLDRQRITIEGNTNANPIHADALHPLACPIVCMVHVLVHPCIALHVNGFEIIQPAPPEHCYRTTVGLIMPWRAALESLSRQACCS